MTWLSNFLARNAGKIVGACIGIVGIAAVSVYRLAAVADGLEAHENLESHPGAVTVKQFTRQYKELRKDIGALVIQQTKTATELGALTRTLRDRRGEDLQFQRDMRQMMQGR